MAKKQQKYICINSYICHVYISINHFKSLCGKTNTKEASQSARQKAEEKDSSYTPAALQINTIQNNFRMYKFASVFQYK